jgi:protocatechuate 3,4-dioxygenase beta subunit
MPADEPGALLLLEAVPVRGRVIDAEGAAVPRARVHACVHDDVRIVDALTDGAGEFTLPGLPSGARLHVLVVRDGYRTEVESRFRAPDFLTLRLLPGAAVSVEAADPSGNAVADVSVRLSVMHAFADLVPRGRPESPGRIVLPDASGGGAVLVHVEAPGHLPLEMLATPGRAAPVVLWPARPVLLRTWDLRTREGVDDVALEVAIRPSGGGAAWAADNVEHVSRLHPVRYSDRAGEQVVRLPACAVDLSCTAPGYEPLEAPVAASASEAALGFTPVRDRTGATLVLRAGRAEADLPLAVADENGEWSRAFVLARGEAEVAVPAGRVLHVASLAAAEGFWVPKMELTPLARGERRVAHVTLRPALRLEVAVDPPVSGSATLVDIVHEGAAPAQQATLADGTARFWVRPLRRVRVRLEPASNHFPREAEIAVEQADLSRVITLSPAAGLGVAVTDPVGHPVPFAEVRLWEPDRQGRVELRVPPRPLRTDATGAALAQGLRPGSAALEIRAPAFRTLRLAAVQLETDRVVAMDPIRLELAVLRRGRVVDPEGRPVPGAWVHVVEPEVARVRAGDVELDSYHTEGSPAEEVATDADGRFEVRDGASRAPLIVVKPSGRADLAAMAFEPVEGDGEYRLPAAAWLALDVPSSVAGVFLVLPQGRAVRIKDDPALSMRPLPVVLPAGRSDLLVLLRSGMWAAPTVDLLPGTTHPLAPPFHR